MTVAGRAECARVVREFVSGVLGSGHPCWENATLLVSEVFGNSVRHSGSDERGGTVTVTVTVTVGGGVIRAGRSPTAAGPGYHSCVLLAVARRAGGGSGSWRPWPRGGGGGGAAAGR
jgi:hypothetical protein